jgi:hypothetical protein
MKKNLLMMMLIASLYAQAQLSPVITSWIQNPDTNLAANRGYNNIPSNVLKVQYSTTDVYVSCFCIPGYSIGPWSNPNVAENQNFTYKITLNPQPNTGTRTPIGLGHIGVLTNGVSIFNANDAQYVNTVWSRNGYYFEYPSFDNCIGHPQQQGEYHHHVSPKCLYDQTDSLHHSPLIGYMFDGYPVYGAYGYANTTGGGGIKRMRSSYRLRSDTSRTTQPDGTPASVQGPSVTQPYTVTGMGGTTTVYYPMGCLLWDYEYVQGLGDLDSSNGRFCVTPEYPNGTYAYFMTLDDTLAPAYPYTSIGSYYGVVQSGNIGAGPNNTGGHNTISVATTSYPDVAGVTDLGIAKFELVPNPVQSYVYIYMDDKSANNVTGKLYNESGQLMQTIEYMQPSIAYTLDLTKYPIGVYLLHMNDGNQDVVRKIVKSN